MPEPKPDTPARGSTAKPSRRRAAGPRSEEQATASRRNGARSTGPVSEDGKARSAMNALAHGLFAARYVVLPEESEVEFRDLRDRCAVELGTKGHAEGGLAHTVATATWREQRLDRVEHALWHGEAEPLDDAEGRAKVELLSRLQARNQTLQLRARAELRRRRQERGAAADEREAALVEQRNTIEWAQEQERARLNAAVAAAEARAAAAEARLAALEAARGGAPAVPRPEQRNEPESADRLAATEGWAQGYALPPAAATAPPAPGRVITKLLASAAPVEARRQARGAAGARRP